MLMHDAGCSLLADMHVHGTLVNDCICLYAWRYRANSMLQESKHVLEILFYVLSGV